MQKIEIVNNKNDIIAFINVEFNEKTKEIRVYLHHATYNGSEYKPLGYVLGHNCLIAKI